MRFFFYIKGSSHNIFWSWLRWIYKAPIVLLRLGDIPVRLCCMEILMSMLRRWIWQLNAKLLTFKCSSLGLVYHYDIIFPKGLGYFFHSCFSSFKSCLHSQLTRNILWFVENCINMNALIIQTDLFTFDITCIICFHIIWCINVATAKCCHLIQASDI